MEFQVRFNPPTPALSGWSPQGSPNKTPAPPCGIVYLNLVSKWVFCTPL